MNINASSSSKHKLFIKACRPTGQHSTEGSPTKDHIYVGLPFITNYRGSLGPHTMCIEGPFDPIEGPTADI